ESLFMLDPDSAYDLISDAHKVRVPHRVLWGMNDDARRFAATVPCSATAGGNVVTLNYVVKSLEVGQEILILGAGVNGGNLTTTITHISGRNVRVADQIVTTVVDALLSRADAPSSIASFEDLEDDGSPI